MPTVTDTYSAKTHLSRLLDEVAAGGEVVITRRGKPIARLVPYAETGATPKRRVLGGLEHLLRPGDLDHDKRTDPDWQAMLDELQAKWDRDPA
jgi:prevent-host-death family protein